ncbi:hypothetical protein BRC69_07375 [Halobacteriales archaeon QH_6_66_25]|nr:MAG: hypothetical protein BRC69_07375 [Halobacteriales archaeon QH_6_66_25]
MLPDRRSLVVLLLAVLLCGYAPASGIAAAAVDGDDGSVEDAVYDSTDSVDAANVSLDQESDDWHDSADSGNGSSGTDATTDGTTDISLVDPTADATSSETTEWTDSDDDFPTVTEDIPEDPENATDGAENATDDVGDDVNDTTDDVDDTTGQSAPTRRLATSVTVRPGRSIRPRWVSCKRSRNRSTPLSRSTAIRSTPR